MADGDLDAVESLINKRADLIQLCQKIVEGVTIRSKTRLMEHEERPSNLFFNLEKRSFVNKSISRIVNKDNCTLARGVDILSETRSFYKKLREIDAEVDLNKFFVDADRNVLSDEMRDRIEGPLTGDEVMKSLNSSKNDKSPGSDGFSYEFYKSFHYVLLCFLVRSLNYAYDSGQLSVTQKNGTLLPKGDKLRQFFKNWRHITLLNTCYKIASACIAERLKSCLPYIIQDHQKGLW